MYDFVDRPVVRLGRGSKFLLWAMRVWTHVIAERGSGPGMLAPAFTQFRVGAALEPIHLAMTLLRHDCLEKLQLSTPACPRIGEDEAVLLATWSNAAAASPALDGTLALLLGPDAVQAARIAMIEAARVFSAAGLPVDGLSATTRTAQR